MIEHLRENQTYAKPNTNKNIQDGMLAARLHCKHGLTSKWLGLSGAAENHTRLAAGARTSRTLLWERSKMKKSVQQQQLQENSNSKVGLDPPRYNLYWFYYSEIGCEDAADRVEHGLIDGGCAFVCLFAFLCTRRLAGCRRSPLCASAVTHPPSRVYICTDHQPASRASSAACLRLPCLWFLL